MQLLTQVSLLTDPDEDAKTDTDTNAYTDYDAGGI